MLLPYFLQPCLFVQDFEEDDDDDDDNDDNEEKKKHIYFIFKAT